MWIIWVNYKCAFQLHVYSFSKKVWKKNDRNFIAQIENWSLQNWFIVLWFDCVVGVSSLMLFYTSFYQVHKNYTNSYCAYKLHAYECINVRMIDLIVFWMECIINAVAHLFCTSSRVKTTLRTKCLVFCFAKHF